MRKDGQTDRHDEANSCFFNFANAPKKGDNILSYTLFLLGFTVFEIVTHKGVKAQ